MAKKALIDNNHFQGDCYGAPSDAVRVAQVEEAANIFEVGNNLEWVDCGDEIEADRYWYSPSAKTFTKFPMDIKSITTEGTTVKVICNTEEGKITTPLWLSAKINSVTMSGQVPSEYSGTFTVTNVIDNNGFMYELSSEPSGECTTLGTVVKAS